MLLFALSHTTAGPLSPKVSDEATAQPLCCCRGGYLSLPEHCHWKYLLNWPGNTYR